MKTNTELMDDIMSYSNYGALVQAFVLEGLRSYSMTIIQADLSDWDKGFINPEAWKGCAKEILEKLEARHEQ